VQIWPRVEHVGPETKMQSTPAILQCTACGMTYNFLARHQGIYKQLFCFLVTQKLCSVLKDWGLLFYSKQAQL
jgi:hypothetical protein